MEQLNRAQLKAASKHVARDRMDEHMEENRVTRLAGVMQGRAYAELVWSCQAGDPERHSGTTSMDPYVWMPSNGMRNDPAYEGFLYRMVPRMTRHLMRRFESPLPSDVMAAFDDAVLDAEDPDRVDPETGWSVRDLAIGFGIAAGGVAFDLHDELHLTALEHLGILDRRDADSLRLLGEDAIDDDGYIKPAPSENANDAPAHGERGVSLFALLG